MSNYEVMIMNEDSKPEYPGNGPDALQQHNFSLPESERPITLEQVKVLIDERFEVLQQQIDFISAQFSINNKNPEKKEKKDKLIHYVKYGDDSGISFRERGNGSEEKFKKMTFVKVLKACIMLFQKCTNGYSDFIEANNIICSQK